MSDLVRNGNPRVSVNKFAEYATSASAARRDRIVKEQLKPFDKPIPQRYALAEKAIVEAFSAPSGRWSEIIFTHIERLRNQSVSSKWHVDRKHSCIEALENILQLEDSLRLLNVTFTPGIRNSVGAILCSNVRIMLRPEVLLEGRVANKEQFGAIKLAFSKTHPMTSEGGVYVAMLMHQYQQIVHGSVANPKMSFAIDVFQRQIFKCPSAYKTRNSELEAAAQEYGQRWSFWQKRLSGH